MDAAWYPKGWDLYLRSLALVETPTTPPDFDKETNFFSASFCLCLKASLCFCFPLWWSPSSHKVGTTFSDLGPDDPAKVYKVQDDNGWSREMRKTQLIGPQLMLFHFSSVSVNRHFLTFYQLAHNRRWEINVSKSQPWSTRTFQSSRGDQRRKVIEGVMLHTGLEAPRWEETQVG